MFGGFNASKLKPQLKMAVSRIQIASNKKAALLKQNMREVAKLLAEGKEEKAKIRAEALIRDDNLIEAYEILQLECELLHERLKLIEVTKTCPSDLISVVSTLMWASHRVDIAELTLIRKQFRSKYGKAFDEAAMNNVNGVLNERVVSKLSVDPPAAYLVQTYVEKIAEQHKIAWKPTVPLSAAEMAEPMPAPVGYSVAVAQGTGLGPVGGLDDGNSPSVLSEKKATVSPQALSVTAADDFVEPDIFVPGAPTHTPGSSTEGASLPPPPAAPSAPSQSDDSTIATNEPSSSYADLAARFDNLKK